MSRTTLTRLLAGAAAGLLCLTGCGGTADKSADEDPPPSSSSASSSPAGDETPSAETEPTPEDANISGGWETSYGQLTFTVTGDRFEGSYDGEFGTLSGTVDGPQVVGEWYEPATSVECEEQRGGTAYWGTFTFVFAEDGNSFDGMWGYCGDAEDSVWTGERRPD
jgi:hypothetical protein